MAWFRQVVHEAKVTSTWERISTEQKDTSTKASPDLKTKAYNYDTKVTKEKSESDSTTHFSREGDEKILLLCYTFIRPDHSNRRSRSSLGPASRGYKEKWKPSNESLGER